MSFHTWSLSTSSTVRVMQSVRLFLLSLDSDVKDQFIGALADLNGDGTLEAIVYLTGEDWERRLHIGDSNSRW